MSTRAICNSVLLGLAFAGAGCAGGSAAAPAELAAPGGAIPEGGHVHAGHVHVVGETEEACPVCALYEARSASVVRIFAADGLGAGFVCSEAGLVVTNAHVVGASETVQVEFADESRFEGLVLARDAEKDLALIRLDVPERSWTPLQSRSGRFVPIGSSIYVIGHPVGLGWTVTQGIVSGRRRAGEIAPIELLQTDAAISPGNSGGPVLDSNGRLVGVVRSKLVAPGVESIGFVIPASEVEAFIDAAPIE
jgi:S1-C subfamily serine protease